MAAALGAESRIHDLCIQLGIGAQQIQRLRAEFGEAYGENRDVKLAEHLAELWSKHRPRYPEAGAGNSHEGVDYNWDAHPDEELGYTPNPIRAVEPGVEAVPDDFQTELSEGSRANYRLVRQDEHDRRELKQLAARIRDISKRAPQGTEFDVGRLRREVVQLEERVRLAA